MSVSVNFASTDSKVVVNGNSPRKLNISGTAVTVTDDPGAGTCDIVITGGGAGTISGGFNLGSGVGLYKDVNGSNIELRSLTAGSNISLTQNTNDVNIAVTGVVTGQSNLGTGTVIGAGISGNNAQLKSIVAGSNVTVTNDANTVTISSTAAGGGGGTITGGANVGNLGYGPYQATAGAILDFQNIAANSNLIAITNDTTNHNILIDVNQANLAIAYSQLTSVPSTIVQTNQVNTFGAFNQTFPSSSLLIQNPAGTFAYIMAGSAITANRTVTIPLLTANDTLVLNTFAATLTNKTMDGGSNTFTNISSTSLPSTTVYNNQANTYSASDQTIPSGNLKISNSGFKAAFSATLTGNRTITFPDSSDTVVFSGDSRMTNARTPTTHASTHESGGSDAIPLDTLGATTDITTLNASTSAHGLLKKLDGTATHYLDGTGAWSTPAGSGGGVSASSTNTWSAVQTFNDGDLALENPLGTFAATVKAGAQTGNVTFTFPVTTSDTIDTINATQTLTNKSMSGSSNTFTNIPSTALPATIPYTGQINTWGAFNQNFPSAHFVILNPAGTFGYVFTGAAITGARTVNLPLLTGTDQLTMDSFATTLSNKTIDAGSNTLSNITNTSISSSAAIAKSKLASLAIADADVASGAAIAWSKISKTGSVLNDISNLNAASPSNNDVLTYNTSSSKWINQAPSSSGNNLPFPDQGMYGAHVADGSTTYTPYGQLARFAGGTATSHFDLIGSEGIYSTLTSLTTIGGKAGWIDNLSSPAFTMDSSPYLKIRCRLNGSGSISRLMFGFSAGSSPPTTDTLVASSTSACILGCRTSDTDIFAITSNGTGSATYTDTGVAYTNTGFHTYEIKMSSSGTATFTIDGTVTNTISTNTPTTGNGMHMHCYLTNSTTTAVTADYKYDMFKATY